jgi:redox-regulated HSP33 family molecular chaperone
VRGRVARLDGVLDQVLKQHSYPPVIEALVSPLTPQNKTCRNAVAAPDT